MLWKQCNKVHIGKGAYRLERYILKILDFFWNRISLSAIIHPNILLSVQTIKQLQCFDSNHSVKHLTQYQTIVLPTN